MAAGQLPAHAECSVYLLRSAGQSGAGQQVAQLSIQQLIRIRLHCTKADLAVALKGCVTSLPEPWLLSPTEERGSTEGTTEGNPGGPEWRISDPGWSPARVK